jgi:16S rRNA (uracil1498-N3)-methyltransferase
MKYIQFKICCMRLHRIYYPVIANIGEQALIVDERAHYIKNVLRLKLGRLFRLFNHVQQEFLVEITSIHKKQLEVKFLEQIDTIKPSKLNITLIQGLSKGDRMDYTIQKATELGITTIIPIISEYCEVRLTGDRLKKKRQHWQNIAISASEQSFRADIANILPPVTLAEYSKENHQGILLEPEAPHTISDIDKLKWQAFDIVVGPEGGWSENDLKSLKATGLSSIKFGQRILRTETVAPAIMAAIHSLWGDFI